MSSSTGSASPGARQGWEHGWQGAALHNLLGSGQALAFGSSTHCELTQEEKGGDGQADHLGCSSPLCLAPERWHKRFWAAVEHHWQGSHYLCPVQGSHSWMYLFSPVAFTSSEAQMYQDDLSGLSTNFGSHHRCHVELSTSRQPAPHWPIRMSFLSSPRAHVLQFAAPKFSATLSPAFHSYTRSHPLFQQQGTRKVSSVVWQPLPISDGLRRKARSAWLEECLLPPAMSISRTIPGLACPENTFLMESPILNVDLSMRCQLPSCYLLSAGVVPQACVPGWEADGCSPWRREGGFPAALLWSVN